jgi:hypothetical protein
MADDSELMEWDFATLVAWWNLYGLPVLLLVVGAVAWLGERARRAAPDGSLRTVGRIGLIHCGLAVWGLIALSQELLAIRATGNPQSHPSLVVAVFGSVVNPLLALGILRRRRGARRFAIVWYVFLSILAIVVSVWLSYYHVAVDAATWPQHLTSKFMPFVLLVVMFMPRIKRVFARPARAATSGPESSGLEVAPALPPDSAGASVLSVIVLLLLVVVCSNLVVDAADWGYRVVTEPEAIP